MIGGQSSFPDYASYLSSINEENFRPSFTDIMMVVVIVFLLSSTVAVLHNWDLSRQVQETAALEQKARERAEDLDLRRMLLQLELEEMQGRMEKTREALEVKTGQLEKREEDLAGAQGALAEQQMQLMDMQEEYARVRAEMKMSEDVSAEREQELLEVQQQLEKMREESVLHEQMYARSRNSSGRPGRNWNSCRRSTRRWARNTRHCPNRPVAPWARWWPPFATGRWTGSRHSC